MMLVVTPNSRPLNTCRGQAAVCAALDLPSFPGFPGRQEKIWNFAVLLNKKRPAAQRQEQKKLEFRNSVNEHGGLGPRLRGRTDRG